MKVRRLDFTYLEFLSGLSVTLRVQPGVWIDVYGDLLLLKKLRRWRV